MLLGHSCDYTFFIIANQVLFSGNKDIKFSRKFITARIMNVDAMESIASLAIIAFCIWWDKSIAHNMAWLLTDEIFAIKQFKSIHKMDLSNKNL